MRQERRIDVGDVGEVPTDKMTYRVNKEKGDRVSILGYGCMGAGLRASAMTAMARRSIRETVNGLVDYAISHGVNYFDTSPVYGSRLVGEGYGHSLEPPSAQFVFLGDRNCQTSRTIRAKIRC